MKKRVLFLCTGNSARSQMAEGILRHLAGNQYEVDSAGTHPKGVHPVTGQVMGEVGIDIRAQTSKSVDTFTGKPIDYVITVCDRASQQCPFFPAAHTIHWSFEDPAAEEEPEKQIVVFRRVRDEIYHRIRLFVSANTPK